jgi:hypothetical protein
MVLDFCVACQPKQKKKKVTRYMNHHYDSEQSQAESKASLEKTESWKTQRGSKAYSQELEEAAEADLTHACPILDLRSTTTTGETGRL